MQKYIIQIGDKNPILRTKSEFIDEITPEIKEFCKDLIKLMRKHDGVGLAAPQVGKNIRIIATTQRNIKKGKEDLLAETIMINPVLKELSQDTTIGEEACISLPGIMGKVKRHKSIIIEYLDIKGNKQKKKLKDFNAVIVQHEIDHLEGVLFTDKLIKNNKVKKM
ncbi:MAG: peptide deformylase [Candidatus Absconditabacteria bacterium]|nr:peptide deformylase [Candidatus Absconditabacteria bacterium]